MIGQLFTRLTGIPLSSDRALLGALCLAARADGRRSELEDGYTLAIALDLPAFRRFGKDGLTTALDAERRRLDADADRAASVHRIAKELASDELREQSYALAAVIVAVDQDVKTDEDAFLSEFRRALGLSEESARKIWAEISRELASLKNDPAAPGRE